LTTARLMLVAALLWFRSAKVPLFVWQPHPHSPQYIHLGNMFAECDPIELNELWLLTGHVVTTTPAIPPIDLVRCAPKARCVVSDDC
jgi:hypothetical protein